jgi:hypothetical protein
MDTSDTITVIDFSQHSIPTPLTPYVAVVAHWGFYLLIDVPDRQDTSSLGKAGLIAHTSDSLLEDRRDFGGRSLCIRSVGSDLARGSVECRWRGFSSLQ